MAGTVVTASINGCVSLVFESTICSSSTPIAVKEKTPYLTFNVPNTVCNDCGHITKQYTDHCPKCGSENVDYLTRVIGYLKRISKFSSARIEEAKKRYYA